MQQEEARKVKKYLETEYSDLRVGIAVSSDTDAPKALNDFKFTNMDILVTVRMAFIGYDCPQITVVGILTNYRDGGHLTQLVGRGLRVWDKMPAREQTCLIIAPDDPRMKDFLALLRQENEEGLRVLKERDEVEREKTGPEVQPPLAFISDAVATTTRAASNDTDLNHVDLKWIEGIKVTVDSGEDATKLMKFLQAAGVHTTTPQPVPEQRSGDEETSFIVQVPKTEKQQIEELKGQTKAAISRHLLALGYTPGDAGYSDAMKLATYKVNEASGVKSAQATTVERATRRLQAALAL